MKLLQKKTIEFALCYLLSNSDDESVIEHFEIVIGSSEPNASDYAEYIRDILDEIRNRIEN